MKGMNYIEEIKRDYALSNDDIADIIEKLSYIARDNGEDDTALCMLVDELS